MTGVQYDESTGYMTADHGRPAYESAIHFASWYTCAQCLKLGLRAGPSKKQNLEGVYCFPMKRADCAGRSGLNEATFFDEGLLIQAISTPNLPYISPNRNLKTPLKGTGARPLEGSGSILFRSCTVRLMGRLSKRQEVLVLQDRLHIQPHVTKEPFKGAWS